MSAGSLQPTTSATAKKPENVTTTKADKTKILAENEEAEPSTDTYSVTFFEKLRRRRHHNKPVAPDAPFFNSETSIETISRGQRFWNMLTQLFTAIFTFPFLSGDRICFHREDLEPKDESCVKAAWESRKEVEDLVNFDCLATKNLYANILEQRKEIQRSKDKYHFADIDLSNFPRWDQNAINRLRTTFQIFDVSGDGVIDFEEFSTVLSEFGDKTSPDIRLKYFSKAETDEFGTIGFEDFLFIFYELTEKALDSPADQSLADTFHKIDHNMNIRCKLDVLGQLQGGLF